MVHGGRIWEDLRCKIDVSIELGMEQRSGKVRNRQEVSEF